MAKALIVEDEPDLRDAVVACFSDNGLDATAVGTVHAALDHLDQHSVDVVIVDLGLPDGSGLDLVRILRGRVPPCGLIIVTGKGDPVDRILGLELGADDYVTKPFVGRELVARVRSVLRRLHVEESAPASAPVTGGPEPGSRVITLGAASVNVPARIVTQAGGGVGVLSAVEMAILLCLHEKAGQAVSRDDLSLASLGRPWEPEDRTIDQHVSSLRRKLGLAASDQETILTVRGLGYLLRKD